MPEVDPNASALRFSVGDIVAPITGSPADPLFSSAGRYADAVVVRLAPFTLVSRECDMVWTQQKPEHLRRVGSDRVLLWPGQPANRATYDLLQRCCAHVGVSSTGGAPVLIDVALVRAHCERLVAESEQRALDRVVFADWTRDRGLGPENRESGAFVLSDADIAITELRRRRVGGWPGRLAREFGWERCSACDGRGLHPFTWSATQTDGQLCDCAGWAREIGEPERMFAQGKVLGLRHASGCGRKPGRCAACKGRGWVRKSGITPGFAAGPGIARTAQRLLDTLDGRCPWAAKSGVQRGECQSCRSRSDSFLRAVLSQHLATANGTEPLVCPDCRGTGHNLAGVLPETAGAME